MERHAYMASEFRGGLDRPLTRNSYYLVNRALTSRSDIAQAA